MPHNRITDLKLDEVSLVDFPANPGARVTLVKRGLAEAIQKFMDEGLSEADARDRALKEFRDNAGPSGNHDDQEVTMDVKELQEKLEELTKGHSDLTEKLAKSDAVIESITKSLEEAGATVEITDDGVSVTMPEVVNDDDNNGEEFIDIDGEQVAKSAVPAPLLKRLEAQQERIDKMEAENSAEKLAKRADEELPNLAGDRMVKGKLLDAISKMDESDAEELTKSLKAADAAVAKMFEEVGKSTAEDDSSATSRLRKMAEDHAEEKGVSYEQAFSTVTESGEGKQLLIESRNEN